MVKVLEGVSCFLLVVIFPHRFTFYDCSISDLHFIDASTIHY
jgi:hypothetical protein